MRTRHVAIGLAACVISSASAGQMPSGPRPSSTATRDPLSLPGDTLPPPLMAALAPPHPTAPNTPPPAQDALPPTPPLGDSMRAAQTALAKCRADGFEVGVAVADSAGVIVLGLQTERAQPGRIYHAMRKNLTALGFGTSSSAVQTKLRGGDFATLARIKPNMTPFPGAIPVFSHGKLIGAIGVSGAPEAESDEACAVAGAAEFHSNG